MTAFSEIIGHESVVRALSKALCAGKVGHAYLFIGPAGVGKKTLARVFAAQLLCRERSGAEGHSCRSCMLFQTGAHPDFITVVPNGNSIKIEQLRELQHNSYLRPLIGDYKIFFFPDAEQLTEAAANSFLKLLEEPPPGVVFLFTAVRPDRILPTIRSRCQVYQLFPVPAAAISNWLQCKGYDPAEAEKRSANCAGLPGKALNFEQSGQGAERIELRRLLDQDLLHWLKFAADLEKKERPDILALMNDWESQIRQELLPGVGKEPVRAGRDFRWEVQVRLIEKLAQAKLMIENNVSPRLAVEEFLMDAGMQIKA